MPGLRVPAVALSLAAVLALPSVTEAQPRKHPLDGKSDEQIFKELEEAERRSPQERDSRRAQQAGTGRDPCAVLTDVDVRRVLKDARPGMRRERESDRPDSATCRWNTDRGRYVSFTLEAAKPGVKPEGDGGESLPGYRKVPNLGDEAAAFVMRRDDRAGRPDVAFLAVRKDATAFRIEFNDIVGKTDEQVIAALRDLAAAALRRI